MEEVDKISEGIAILILSVIGVSIEKLSQAEDWLLEMPGKTAQVILLYVTGIIVCEKKATNSKIAKRVGFTSHDTLTRTILKGKRVISRVSILLINYCLSQTTGYLVIDDVLVDKRYASHIQGVYNEYDTVEKERIKGMRIVMILWCNGRIRIPIAWAIWHKENKTLIGYTKKGYPRYQHTGRCLLEINGQSVPYKTKNQIAVELLEEVLIRGIKPEYITFDSWYASRDNLELITENRFGISLDCYARIKPNRLVIYEGQEMSVKSLLCLMAKNSFNHKHGAYLKTIQVYLKGFGEIKLLFIKRDTHQESNTTKFLFSTDLSASASDILLRYRSRWVIETAFRDLKQNLNLESCQSRSLDAQESHIALSIFAFVSLELLPALQFQQVPAHSLGEKKLLLSSLSLFTDKERRKYWLIDSSKHDSNFIPLSDSSLGLVNLRLDRAQESLVFPICQRAA